LAVRKLVQERGLKKKTADDETVSEAMGAILCFAGPPGVGKTSLGKSIARRHLLPRQITAHGLRDDEVTFTEDALRKIIQDYTREAGVRNLKRQIGVICRKSVVKIVSGQWSHVLITPELVRTYL
jgi:ATP-dependent Lon protease